ncbi:MAG TPA: AAA family ATPase [Solirubrobacteraceae bacterium]|nr:AAA family ATPase [Solirubrobacteraceae bacterium]
MSAATSFEGFDGPVTIRHVRFANEQTGWAVLDAAAADGTPIALVGPLVHLEEGERARIRGEWVTDSRYGRQVKVSEAHPLAPDDPETVAGYLRRVKHVGARRASALIERFGAAEVLDRVDADPIAAFAEVGLRSVRAQEATASWRSIRVTRRLHLLLAPHGLAYLAGRIHEHYGSEAHELIAANPYELTSVFGVGFAIADRIARASAAERGVPLDEHRRARAAVMHVLAESERSGSSCLPLEDLLRGAGTLVGSPEVDARVVEGLVADGRAVREGIWVYRAATAELEAELAERVGALCSAEPSERLRAAEDRVIDRGALTDEQLGALEAAFAHRLSVITGGPGTGKTASIRTIAAEAAARGARVMLVAPTGRAAVRMSEAGGGLTARTVHSALGWIPGEGPTRDEDDPLACELLIVDETSMANLELLVALLRAVGPDTHVVLVGDADQLAPVGAGKPFAELVASDVVPTTRLTHIFRQAADSMIVQGAHAIRRGLVPEFRPAEGMRRDLFLIERSAPRDGVAEIVSLVAERLPAHYGVDPVRDIQVFAPVYRGELGIDALNRALREALNPNGPPVRGGRLRIGDKLMMTGRNLHELGLMNGTLLRLLDETGVGDSGERVGRGGGGGPREGGGRDGRRNAGAPERAGHLTHTGGGFDAQRSPDAEDGDGDEAALVLAAEDAVFRLPPEEAEQLRLAYACSVHRGQGIELPIAVIVAHPAAGAFFLRREMLYTAVTRASVATIIVGTREVLARAVGSTDTGRRHGRVAERLAARAGSLPGAPGREAGRPRASPGI